MTYFKSALQIYEAPGGIDMLVARPLSEQGFSGKLVAIELTEIDAMRKVVELPYLDELGTTTGGG